MILQKSFRHIVFAYANAPSHFSYNGWVAERARSRVFEEPTIESFFPLCRVGFHSTLGADKTNAALSRARKFTNQEDADNGNRRREVLFPMLQGEQRSICISVLKNILIKWILNGLFD